MRRLAFLVVYSVTVCLFVLRFYGPVNPMGSCRARSVYLTTRLLSRLRPLSGYIVISIMHILSPETDNCPSWISGRERMTVENISWSCTKECCRPQRGLNPRPPGLQSDGASYWTTEAGLSHCCCPKSCTTKCQTTDSKTARPWPCLDGLSAAHY